MSPFSGSFLAIERGYCPIQPPADFQVPSISKLGTQQLIPFPNSFIWYTRYNVVVIALIDDEEDHGSHPIKVYLY
jgi:hypothetical protein